MAFATFFTLTGDSFGRRKGGQTKLYNFDGQVRSFAGGGNKTDVMLLQALFRIFYYEFLGFGSAPIPAGSTGVITVDGIVGKQTRIHIQDFQTLMERKGATLTTDGVIDPFAKQGIRTPHTRTQFQLLRLNFECQDIAFGNNAFDVHENMIDHVTHAGEIYPNELRTALRIARAMR